MIAFFKNNRYVLLSLSVVLCLSLGAYYFHGQVLRLKSIPSAQIAFVNLSRIRNEATSLIKLRELVEESYKKFKDEIHSQELAIREEHKILESQKGRSAKDKAELQKRRQSHDKKIKEMSSIIQEKKNKLNETFSKITESIEIEIQEIVNLLAKEHHLNLVFNSSTMDTSVILYGGEDLDITDEVLAQLNKRMPTVHLKA